MYVLQVVSEPMQKVPSSSTRILTDWEKSDVKVKSNIGDVMQAFRVLREIIVNELSNGNLLIFQYPRYYPHVDLLQQVNNAIKPPSLDVRKEWVNGIDKLVQLVSDWEQRRVIVYRTDVDKSTSFSPKTPLSIPTSSQVAAAKLPPARIISQTSQSQTPPPPDESRSTGGKKKKLPNFLKRLFSKNKDS